MDEKTPTAEFKHTFENDRVTAKIHLYKIDKETGKPVPQGDAKLEGAVYGLYARNDIVHPDGKTGVLYKKGEKVAELKTDASAEAEIKNLRNEQEPREPAIGDHRKDDKSRLCPSYRTHSDHLYM